VEVIPWLVADSTFARYSSPRIDPQKTVFVGALHGVINAQVTGYLWKREDYILQIARGFLIV
jgi:hypothetical protein